MPLENLYNIKNSHVFLRADMDVPLNQGKILSNYRILRCIATLKLLLEQNNKVVIFTKIGRPGGKEPELSTKNILNEIKELTNKHIMHIRNKDELNMMYKTNEGLFLFENTRFFDWEGSKFAGNSKNNKQDLDKVAQDIALKFDHYVDEAFAMSHREETTNFLIPKHIKRVSLGINYIDEIKNLEKVKLGKFKNPSYFILGGAKTETKIPVINSISDKFEEILIGGLMPKEIKNHNITAQNLYISSLEEHSFDINKEATEHITKKIEEASTIVWNGPTGMFENEKYSYSTKKIIKAIENNKNAYKLAGGGDTIEAIDKFGNFDNYSFISTGGGAMFSYLSGESTNTDKIKRDTNIF